MKLLFHRISKGFTLVELLIVMTIIAVMMVLATTVMRDTGTGRTLDSGLYLVENLIQEARATAQGKDTYARVIFVTAPNDTSKNSVHLRYVGVQYLEKADAKGQNDPAAKLQGKWISTSSGLMLPPGVFFSPSYSRALSWAEGSSDRVGTTTTEINKDKNRRVYYFEFDEKGRYVAPSAGPNSPTQPHRVVLISARLGKDNRHARDGITPSQLDSRRRPAGAKGLVIWPAGNTSRLRTREQIFSR